MLSITGMNMNKQPTISEVAALANVSSQTVSRVINNRDNVTPETRERVLAAIDKTGYHPNPIARRLKYGQTHTLGFILPDISNPLFGDAMKGADHYIRNSDYKHYELLFFNTEGIPEREKKGVDLFVDRRMEGIIIASSASEMIIEHIRKILDDRNMIVVAVDNQLGDLNVDLVSSDNFKGAYLLTSHLIKLGHKSIAAITGPSNESSSIGRLDGYKAALKEYGIPFDEKIIITGDWTKGTSKTITPQLFTVDPKPTAIFAFNNSTSLGALLALKEHRIRVPDEIAVVSFDDVENGDLLSPALTTTNTSWYELGRVAAELLLSRINEEKTKPRNIITLPIDLVVRESCGINLISIRNSE
jgi:DNA-binding LacI/PurR family transcriptional regulator